MYGAVRSNIFHTALEFIFGMTLVLLDTVISLWFISAPCSHQPWRGTLPCVTFLKSPGVPSRERAPYR